MLAILSELEPVCLIVIALILLVKALVELATKIRESFKGGDLPTSIVVTEAVAARLDQLREAGMRSTDEWRTVGQTLAAMTTTLQATTSILAELRDRQINTHQMTQTIHERIKDSSK